jgi:signal transduction histidine kinase
VRAAGLPVDLAVEGDALPLPGGVELAAYRVVQESLTNALKHAHATRASVRLRYGGAALDVVVTDDGGGVQANGGGTGHGLIGLRERVALYGGSFAARPLPAGGFEVRASLPIEPGR